MPTAEDVPTRLVEAGMLILDHMAHLGAMMQSLAASGYNVHQQRAQHHQDQRNQRAEDAVEDDPSRFMRELTEATTSLLPHDEPQLRIPTDQFVRMYLGLLTTTRFEPLSREDRRTTVARRLDVLLNGARES